MSLTPDVQKLNSFILKYVYFTDITSNYSLDDFFFIKNRKAITSAAPIGSDIHVRLTFSHRPATM